MSTLSSSIKKQSKMPALLLAAFLLNWQLLPAIGEDNESSKPQAKQQIASTVPMLKGEVTYTVPCGTPIKLKLASVPTQGLKLAEKDFEGNCLPAELNQPITAKTTEDIYVDDNKVIPQGTVFYGKVSKIYPPKRMGRPGHLALSFDHFTTPDGKKFAFAVEANNEKASTGKTKAKGFGLVAAHAAGGAIVGTLAVYAVMGIRSTIALHGYNLAAGAAVGALGGTAVALMRHGHVAVLEPGDDLNMSIDSDLLIPAAVAPKPKKIVENLPGLNIEVIKTKTMKDGLQGHQLYVQLFIDNNSDKRLQSIDLFVRDDNGNMSPISTDTDEESEYIFNVDPHTMKRVNCYFQIEYPKLKRKLVWLENDSRHQLYESQLP